ncbi:hypothetical protein ACQP1W_34715 [Spirillospora sp. CA-255316]
MEELVLYQRSNIKRLLGTAFLIGFGVLMVGAGLVRALQGGLDVLLSVPAFVMGGAPLAFALFMLRAGRGAPDRLVLTPQGVQVSRGKETFLLPTHAIGSFTVVPVKSFYSINLRFDPASLPPFPAYVSRLGAETQPGELRLLFVGDQKPFVPMARAAQARTFVQSHGLGEWHDLPQLT